MTFFDYEMTVTRNGNDVYRLCADMKPLPWGHFCKVYRHNEIWMRATQWGAVGGRRYVGYTTLDEALTAGVKWARRREKE